jgi:hypothetical protein
MHVIRNGKDYYPCLAGAVARSRLDALLPPGPSLSQRWEALRSRMHVPLDRLPEVFAAAIAEARARVQQYMAALPEGEAFDLEYVTDKPWTGYNWYKVWQ